MLRKGIHLGPMNKNSKFYKFLRNIDCFVFVNRGLIPDLERLDFVREERKFFSDEGLIRISMSIIPGTDRSLKTAVKALGGWDLITHPSFLVTEDVYSRLEAAGLSRKVFDKSRAYLAKSTSYGR